MNRRSKRDEIYEKLSKSILLQIKAGAFSEEDMKQFVTKNPTLAQEFAKDDELCEVWPLLRKMKTFSGAGDN